MIYHLGAYLVRLSGGRILDAVAATADRALYPKATPVPDHVTITAKCDLHPGVDAEWHGTVQEGAASGTHWYRVDCAKCSTWDVAAQARRRAERAAAS